MSDVGASLVKAAALESYLDAQLGGEMPLETERHRAGHSNETFFVTRGERELVLRRPPSGAFLPTAHDVGREYRVLSALDGTDVRSPATVLMCEDESIIGAPFYLMERARGFVVRGVVPDGFGPTDLGGFGDEMVDALVTLHAVDVEACGLGGFGKPSGYLERQLRRWSGQLELTMPFTRPLPDLEAIGEWLRRNLPESPAATLVHGDYKLDNVMYATQPPARLVAILDWEMSTLGDPLADLGWMASFWVGPDEGGGVFGELSRVTASPGFRTRDELVERYVSASGRSVDSLDWYRVLAIWKLAILLEGSYARHLAGASDDPFFAGMEHGVPELADHARSLAGT